MRARLEAIYEAIPDRARRVADVGYDQGILIDALLERRPGVRVVGVERQDAAAHLYRARHEAELTHWGARVALRTGDGLTAILPGEVDVAVIAGIGARSVARMLRAAPGVLAHLDVLVLCCPRFNGELMPALDDLALTPLATRLVRDRGHIYEVTTASPAHQRARGDELTRHYGAPLLCGRDPLALPYLEGVRRTFAAAFRSDLASYGPLSTQPDLGRKLALLDAAIARVRAAAEPSGAPTAA